MGILKFFDIFRRKKFDVGSIDFLLFGIGNPGSDYEGTRHNAGFMAIDSLAARFPDRIDGELDNAIVARATTASGKNVLLAKPLTFVNRSGDSFRSLVNRLNISLESCIVVTDDLNLPLGKLRFRKNGSSGGHNGLKSIIDTSGKQFPRLRIGIGPVPKGMPVVEFVLGKFEDHEMEHLDEVRNRSADALLYFCDRGIEAAMNTYNSA